MPEEITKQKPEVWRRINWPGAIAGVLTIALPFMGTWWRLTLGMDAVIMEISPFGVDMSFFGEEAISTPLFWWLCLGLKLGVVYLGVLLLVGSILSISDRRAAIAEQFVRFSARKLLWLVVAFVVLLLIVITLVNQLPGIFSSFIGDSFFQLQSDLPYYLSGEGTISGEAEGVGMGMGMGMHLTLPVFMKLTRAFAVAVLAVTLGIVFESLSEKGFDL